MMAVYYPRPKHESMCKLDDRNPFGWVGNVVVHSDYRSRGLARVLLSDAVHHLQASLHTPRLAVLKWALLLNPILITRTSDPASVLPTDAVHPLQAGLAEVRLFGSYGA
jgi:GNAT superfamily N-acetyltransferase